MSARSFLLYCVFGAFLAIHPVQAQPAPASRVLQAVDNSVRVKLPGNVHPLARLEFDRGEAPADLPLNRMLLVLKRSDQQEAELLHLMENQQFKKSPSYHKWLTPVEFGAQFGPTDADIAAVTNWLQASGFQVAQVSKGRTIIEFNGTAGLMKQAFGTAIHKFVVKGEEHWANVNDPSIPAALAPVVAGIDSLHNFPKKPQVRTLGQYSLKTKKLTPNPDYTVSGCGANCYAVTPFDFATIYDLLPLWNAATPINGTGQTIAIVGQTEINPADATTFWNLLGLDGSHAPTPTLTITHNGPSPGFIGDESEADLDTQWSGAAAPGATINFVTSASTETTAGIDLSALYIIDNNLAPVMSESYGECEAHLGNAAVNFYAALWEQAAAQGITAMISAGDGGAAGCDNFNTATAASGGLAVSGFASTPFNVAVGGTDFNQFRKESTYWNTTNDPATQKSAKGYIPETTWNDSCANSLFQFLTGGTTNAETNCNNPNFSTFQDIVSGSGGASAAWPKPSWQTGTGVPNDNARDLPDVSLFASDGFLGSFYTFCKTDSTGGVCDLNNLLGAGGTSVSSPAFAGIMALVNQKWGPQGNANFVLYKLAASHPTAFHDTPAGSTIAVPCVKGTANCNTTNNADALGILSGYATTTGYDLATGLGSVDAALLVNNWNTVTFTPTTTTLTLNSGNAVNITHGTAVPVTVAVSPAAATGDVSLLVNPGTPGNPGIDFANLVSGTATGTTSLLPGGTYKVIAHYAGDGTYGGSYSAPSATVTVNAENSTVFMPGVETGTDTLGNPVYATSVGYGTPYLLRADVQNAAGAFCGSGCPTGSIAFTNNGSPLDAGTYPLNSLGYTEDFAIQLPGGANTLVAKYSGDSSYKTSTTTTVVTITKAATSISNVQAVAVAQPGVSFSVSATVVSASSGVGPGGTVSFFANGVLLPGTVLLSPMAGPNASLGATILSTTINTPGNYNITATYTGDANYAAVTTSNSYPMSVFDLTTSTPPDPPAANPGQSATTTMTVTPVGTATFTNDVTFSCSGLTGTGLSCAFNPTKFSAGANAGSVTITVQSAGPFTGAAGAARRNPSASNRHPWLPLTLPVAGMLLLGLGGWRLPRRYRRLATAMPAVVLVAFLISCGGGGSSTPPPVTVAVSPGTVNTLYPNLVVNGVAAPAQTQQFSAVVSNATTPGVNWSVTGGAANGSISASGLYSAPATLPAASSITVVATSTADSTKTGRATVTLLAPTSSGPHAITVSAVEGQLQKATSFNLTVN